MTWFAFNKLMPEANIRIFGMVDLFDSRSDKCINTTAMMNNKYKYSVDHLKSKRYED